jgi:glucose-6-phosphate 1-epimerase
MTDTFLSTHVTLSQINELEVLRISNSQASATVAIQGAQIIEYTPVGRENLLFVSAAENFKKDEAIRGGIPICWPWFGPHSTEENAPAHGFVRTAPWHYEIITDTADRTDIRFWLDTEGEQVGFPHKARVELLVSMGETLVVSLTTENQSDAPFSVSQALHTYFNCKDINDVRVLGLTGACYQNKLSNENAYIPTDFRFNQEIDWVVQEAGNPVGLRGLGNHAIKMTRMGSRSLILWNPWIDKSKTLSHFNAEDYQRMFCVETANASEDRRMIKTNATHVLMMEISAVDDEAS